MHIGVGEIRKSKGLSKDFGWDSPYQLSGLELEGPLLLELKVTNAGSRMMVVGPLQVKVKLCCSRCSEDILLPLKLRLEEEFLPSHSEEARNRAQDLLDGIFTFENDRLELDELMRQEIEAAFPIQVLCQPHCRGLCGQCGGNLNQVQCNCPAESLDSRWAQLQPWSEGQSVEVTKKHKK